MKKCRRCGELKDESEFYVDKKSRDGLRVCCRSCVTADKRANYDPGMESVDDMAKVAACLVGLGQRPKLVGLEIRIPGRVFRFSKAGFLRGVYEKAGDHYKKL